MSSLFKQFKMDAKKESEGIEIQYAPNADKTIPTFRVRRMGPANTAWAKALERASRPYKRQLQLDTLDEATNRRISMQVMLETVLVGWSNVQDADGKELVYSMENAKMIFNALPELYLDICGQAANAALFHDDAQESDAKNS